MIIGNGNFYVIFFFWIYKFFYDVVIYGLDEINILVINKNNFSVVFYYCYEYVN